LLSGQKIAIMQRQLEEQKYMTQFWAVGGVFTDGTFSKLERDGEECHGPFSTKEEAEALAMKKFRHNIDICWYQLFVTQTV
jgi:hypothetical protein